MSELKNCPFCGSEIEFIPSHVEEQNFVNSASIICRKCRKEYVGATFIVPGEIESEELTNNILINWWNTRPAEDAKDKEIDNLKRALQQIVEIANRRGHLTVATLQKDAWYGLAKIAKEALANAPNTGKMKENKNETVQIC